MTGAAAVPGATEPLDVLREQGYVVLHDLLTTAELDALREELRPLLAAGPLGRNPFEGERSNRLYALLAKAESSAVPVEHPRVLALIEPLLPPNHLPTACHAI